MATIAKKIKNRSGFMLALLLMMLIGAGQTMAKTVPGEKKEKAPTEKKKKKDKSTTKKQANTTWYFNGSSSQILNAGSWSTSVVPTDCEDDGTRPCSISVSASNSTQLQSFLNTQTASQVTTLSPQKRP